MMDNECMPLAATKRTMMLFPDDLRPGAVIVTTCYFDASCNKYGSTHGPGLDHELTVVRVRSDGNATGAIIVDEVGQEWAWSRNNINAVRVRA